MCEVSVLILFDDMLIWNSFRGMCYGYFSKITITMDEILRLVFWISKKVTIGRSAKFKGFAFPLKWGGSPRSCFYPK